MKESFVFLADGFEDIEALTVIDLLRRAGMPVKTVSIASSLQVKSAHGITITADEAFDDKLFVNPEWLILPGGMPGATNLYEFAPLGELLRRHSGNGGHIAAICAAPAVVLGQLGLLEGEKATCYPGFGNLLKGAEAVDAPVVVSGKFVTASGPAKAMAWVLEIIRVQCGLQKMEEVASGLLYAGHADGSDCALG